MRSIFREFCEETGISEDKVSPWFHIPPFSHTYYVEKSHKKGRSRKLKEVKYWVARLEANVDVNVQVLLLGS